MMTIAWDIDDVLNELMREWLVWWKAVHPECGIAYSDILVNPPHELIGVTLDEYLASLDQFRLKNYLSLTPNMQMRQWFEQHGAKAHHLVLSAVSLNCAHLSAQWVVRHFGHWIRSFHFIPSHRGEHETLVFDETKADFLKRTGFVDAFIDDSPNNVRQAQEAGVTTYLLDRPWNQGGEPLAVILEKVTKDIS